MKVDNEDLNVEEEVVNIEEEEIVEESDVSEEADPEIVQDEVEDDDEEDRIVTIGDEPAEEEAEDEPEPEPKNVIKTLRHVNRGYEKKIKALERQMKEMKETTENEKPVELGQKPTLKSCEYDDGKYEQELVKFYERKRVVEEQAAERAKIVEEQNEALKARETKYVELKKEHSFKDFADAEDLVQSTFSITQQGIIVSGADDAALLVYALGKNPKKLEELAKIKNPIDFAFKVAKLESQLKVTNKKAPKPEQRVSGGKSGGLSGDPDKVLERLEAEADKTGDRSKVVAYKRKLRNKG